MRSVRFWDKDEQISEILSLLERNYKREYELYHSRPEQKKRRAMRNKSRRKFERAGKVKKGDGNDVHHRDGNPENLSTDNAVVMNKSRNRSMKERITSTGEKAKKLGLKHVGQGRYADRRGTITHKSVDGKLVPVKSKSSTVKAGPTTVSQKVKSSPATTKTAQTISTPSATPDNFSGEQKKQISSQILKQYMFLFQCIIKH